MPVTDLNILLSHFALSDLLVILWNWWTFLHTVKREMLAAIICGSFENITTWQRFNWGYYWKKVGGVHIFHLVTTNFGEIYLYANFAK